MSDVQLGYAEGRFALQVSENDEPHRLIDLTERQVADLLHQASMALAVKQAVAGKDPLFQEPMINAFSPSMTTGMDGHGNAVVQFQLASMPPMRFRLTDDDARYIIKHLQEVLDTPADVRTADKPS